MVRGERSEKFQRAAALCTPTSCAYDTGILIEKPGCTCWSICMKRQKRNGVKYVSLFVCSQSNMGVGRGAVPPRVFLHDTDKAEGNLMVLFFGLVFLLLPSMEIFLPMPLQSNCKSFLEYSSSYKL